MSKDPRESGDSLPSLEQLGEKISAMKKADAPAEPTTQKELGRVMRMGVELVSCVGIGVASGYFLDKWLETTPIFMLICFCFGVAAGFMTLYRSAMQMEKDMETNNADQQK